MIETDSEKIVSQFVNDCPPAPVILFTGAGASRPLGFPTTTEFFASHFELQDRLFKPKSRDFTNYTAPIFTALVESLWPNQSEEMNVGFDVEEIIELVHWLTENTAEKESRFFQASDTLRSICQHTQAFTLDHLIQSRNGRVASMQEYGLRGRLIQLDEELKNAVYVNYRCGDDIADAASNLYNPLFHALGQAIINNIPGSVQRYALPIFTTNYDRSLDMILDVEARAEGVAKALDVPSASQIDGFDQDTLRHSREYFWDPKHYTEQWQGVEPANDCIVVPYFKLHGSLGWRERNGRVVRTDAEDRPAVGSPDQEMLIYPGEKVEPEDDPLKTMYAMLKAFLQEAKLVIVIGFSLRDEVIYRYFKEAAHGGTKFIFVTPHKPPDQVNTLQGEVAKRGTIEHWAAEFGADTDYAQLQVLVNRLIG